MTDILADVYSFVEELERKGRFAMSKDFIQHGSTSVYTHSIDVAVRSVSLMRSMRVRVNEEALIRGALLHDYFLYDWHDPDPSHKWHGFYHPGTALRNAREDFIITDTEADIIKRHMFPLTVIPPSSREGMLVCMADKLVATGETAMVRQLAKMVRLSS